MDTRIISAFPGTGKTVFYRANTDTTLDSDSSGFSWTIRNGKRVRNPQFPHNYIDHIKKNIGVREYILVSSHKEVRDALKKHCLYFYLVYPSETMKEQYLERYRDRGDQESFLTLLDDNWKTWIRQCILETRCSHQRLRNSWYLEDCINNRIHSELKGE